MCIKTASDTIINQATTLHSGNEWFPGVATNSGNRRYYYAISGSESVTDRAYPALQWPVQMRTAPSITFYPGRSDTTNTADRITRIQWN